MTGFTDDDDMMAAEYVLGTLSPEERRAAVARRDDDTAFGEAVAAWENRLLPLSEANREHDVPANLWAAILRRIGLPEMPARDDAAAAARTVVALHRSVRRWRGATAALSALAACLALLVVISALRPSPAAPTLVAFLEKTGEQPAYLVKASADDRVLSVKPVAAVAPANRSYELWLIDPAVGAPKSLGLLGATPSAHPIPAGIAPDVVARATYAVTEEPSGGSPTGAPSGSPVFVGHLVSSAF